MENTLVFLYDGSMNTTTTLYQLAKAFQEAAISSVFCENDLICVINTKHMPYYVNLADNILAAYKGERGLRGYLEITFSDEDLSDIEYSEMQHQQQCLLMLHEESLKDLNKDEQQAIKESKVSFAKGQFPSFHSKAPYAYIVPLSKEEEEDFILILRALLFAKEYFSQYKKPNKNNSVLNWLETQNLEDIQKREYLPTIKADGDSFIVTAEVLDDDAYGVYYPQAVFSDTQKQLYYKRLKPKPGRIFYIAIGVMPNPVLSEEDKQIIFPMYQVVYDPVADQVLDLYMVEDYEQEHGKFVARLLEMFEAGDKPQAIHCYSKRTMALLSQLGKQIGVMVVEGVEKERMQELLIEMFEEVSSNHHHDES